MITTLSSATKTVTIGDDSPVRIIGERINPTNRKKLAAALASGDIDIVRREALAQVEAGADILDVNVGAPEIDEVAVLPQAVQMVQEATDVPIAIDTANPVALKAALEVCQGKPLVNSCNGEEKALETVLPLVAEYGAAVIGLVMDDDGISNEPSKRVEIARKLIERAEALGIPREDILIDPLAMTVSADHKAGTVTLETIRRIKSELDMNMTLGASNVSFGLPDRELVNRIWLPLVIQLGVNCPITNAAKVKDVILATDVLLGRDEYAMRFIKHFRAQQKKQKAQS